MILNEEQILERLVCSDPLKRIVITPIIDPEEQFGPTSVDLRLGTDFQVIKRPNITHLDFIKDPSELNKNTTKYIIPVKVGVTEPFVLHPGEFALASTLEYIKVPLDLAARLEGRSTWGRLGLLIHATAGFVDPGFCGALTFELANVGQVPMPLYPGVRISQICFFQSNTTKLPYSEKKYTKYSGKTSTASSAYFEDPEYAKIKRVSRDKIY
ncbi:MAG: dCTP deaminase [bacterium]